MYFVIRFGIKVSKGIYGNVTICPSVRDLHGQPMTLKLQLVSSGIVKKGKTNLNFMLFNPLVSGVPPFVPPTLGGIQTPRRNNLCLYSSLILATPLYTDIEQIKFVSTTDPRSWKCNKGQQLVHKNDHIFQVSIVSHGIWFLLVMNQVNMKGANFVMV